MYHLALYLNKRSFVAALFHIVGLFKVLLLLLLLLLFLWLPGRGHETLVRFTNNVNSPAFPGGQPPCTLTRRGRPMAVHTHGAASLAPYDGWVLAYTRMQACYTMTVLQFTES